MCGGCAPVECSGAWQFVTGTTLTPREPCVKLVAMSNSVTLADVERKHVLAVLEEHEGNRTQTAKALGIDRRTFYRKLRRWAEAGLIPKLPQRTARRTCRHCGAATT